MARRDIMEEVRFLREECQYHQTRVDQFVDSLAHLQEPSLNQSVKTNRIAAEAIVCAIFLCFQAVVVVILRLLAPFVFPSSSCSDLK